MKIIIENNSRGLGRSAGKLAARIIREAIRQNGEAHIVLATGASQFEVLDQLTNEKDMAWDRVIMFHLDEYIGLPESHGASFRKYLKERFLDKVPPLKTTCLINGENDPAEECKRVSNLIKAHPIDLALVGIGENGHLAFNDPPADFQTKEPYLVVNLDEQCRRQQFKEGWFNAVAEVPQKAISMSINQIMRSKSVICSVPDKRKAQAVRNCLEGSVNNSFPASILRRHENCTCFLDKDSASLLTGISDNDNVNLNR